MNKPIPRVDFIKDIPGPFTEKLVRLCNFFELYSIWQVMDIVANLNKRTAAEILAEIDNLNLENIDQRIKNVLAYVIFSYLYAVFDRFESFSNEDDDYVVYLRPEGHDSMYYYQHMDDYIKICLSMMITWAKWLGKDVSDLFPE